VQPAHGAVTMNSDGSFTYTPTGGFHGVDSFNYVASDGYATSTAAVRIAVSNTPPVAGSYTWYTSLHTDVAYTLDILNLLSNGAPYAPVVSDSDGDAITDVRIVRHDPHCAVTWNGSVLTFQALDGYTGDFHFNYQVFDGYDWSNVGSISVSVVIPYARDGAGFTVARGDSLIIPMSALLANDAGRSGYLRVTDVGGPGRNIVWAAIDDDYDPVFDPSSGLEVNNVVIYRPEADFTAGDYTFTYTVGDDSNGFLLLDGFATVTIHVI